MKETKFKDYGVYLLLRLDKCDAVQEFIDVFNEKSKTDINLARIWKSTYCDIVNDEVDKVQVLIRLEPHMRFTRYAVPFLVGKGAKLGLEKAGYTGTYESCTDKDKIAAYAKEYIFGV